MAAQYFYILIGIGDAKFTTPTRRTFGTALCKRLQLVLTHMVLCGMVRSVFVASYFLVLKMQLTFSSILHFSPQCRRAGFTYFGIWKYLTSTQSMRIPLTNEALKHAANVYLFAVVAGNCMRLRLYNASLLGLII